MAGVELHRKIIENTHTNGSDQDHFNVIHLSRSCDIQDRTDFLLGDSSINPADGMFRTFQSAARALNKNDFGGVGGVPCNTFHAKTIWDNFIDRMNEISGIEMIDMLENTLKFILSAYPGKKNIGLLSTSGTRAVNIYADLFAKNGLRIVQVSENDQLQVHDSIYNPKWGIKSVAPVTQKARDNFLQYVKSLQNSGAELIVLGCSEIPLALPEKTIDEVALIDPVTVLARAMISKANPNKLKPLD